MVYGEDVSHTVTEQGIAYCYMAEDAEERKLMLASIAQGTPFGELVTKEQIEAFRKAGKVAYPEDLGIDRAMATKDLLALQEPGGDRGVLRRAVCGARKVPQERLSILLSR